MIYFVLVGILISLFLKKNPLTIVAVELKAPFVMIGCLLVQIVLAYLAIVKHLYYPIILDITFIIMLVCLFLNRHLPGVKWIFAGALLNTLALILHNGFMPVSETAMKIAKLDVSFQGDSRHQSMEDSIFWWLGDWIPFFTPIGTNYVISLGDVFVGIGLILFIVRNSLKGQRE
ncbi:putative RDD family membrane protein YckC [Anoxybacillus calidus]|uniref:Putative RDD family membrane protein YckC n=1 Tax=[Anoxybacillus] calidus TaxID=575178 RepID=A0A7W0BTP5_9BACL|nr:DUF5317 domain-containing protein [Anoxybacillus calidus]MBA2870381.1 putative RDD family membrane protein YckC [Anoxybacillus calidus]